MKSRLHINEVAQLFAVTPRTVYYWVERFQLETRDARLSRRAIRQIIALYPTLQYRRAAVWERMQRLRQEFGA
ncbi:MAG: hypothetical protein D6712_17765 [Chloroflexi bacterium]|nr:MAG: hypothetical protein D6712_17765 [Chloroflexota bacterium]